MTYSTPQLVILGAAHTLVLGGTQGQFDNFVSETSNPIAGAAVGLDD
jgi:hypothetical protein